MNWIKGIGSVLLTIFIFGIVIWWLAIVLSKIGMAPVINAKGAIALDQYGRAKDILTFVFPLATAAVGFWFGNQGTVQAQQQADTARQSSQAAHEQAKQSQTKLETVLGVSEDSHLIEKAAAAAPSAFPEVTSAATTNGAAGAVP